MFGQESCTRSTTINPTAEQMVLGMFDRDKFNFIDFTHFVCASIIMNGNSKEKKSKVNNILILAAHRVD